MIARMSPSVTRPASAASSQDVAVVLVNYNGTEDTLRCLKSLSGLESSRCLSIVVDNGSRPDASGEIAEACSWAHVVRREVNGGWAGGNNTGIRRALELGVEWIVLLNNDTIVAPSLIDQLLEAARRHPRYRVLGPIIHYMDEPDVVMTDGCRFNRAGYPGFFERLEVSPSSEVPSRVVDVDIVNGCCMMVAAEVFHRVGLIDERFFLIHEESDLCLRAGRAGFACGVLAEPLVWHKGSSSFQREGRSLQRYYDTRNLFLLLRKHAGTHMRRSVWASWAWYLRHAYHRYAIERERGHDAAAESVLRGLSDALAGYYGACREGDREVPFWIRAAFGFAYRMRGHPTP